MKFCSIDKYFNHEHARFFQLEFFVRDPSEPRVRLRAHWHVRVQRYSGLHDQKARAELQGQFRRQHLEKFSQPGLEYSNGRHGNRYVNRSKQTLANGNDNNFSCIPRDSFLQIILATTHRLGLRKGLRRQRRQTFDASLLRGQIENHFGQIM